MKKLLLLAVSAFVCTAASAEVPEPVFFNDFEDGLNDCTIVGDGQIIDDPQFGKIFANAMDGMRKNYLLLPSDALSHSGETKEISISMWVNRGAETDVWHYMWCPLLTAYGSEPNPENTWPMLACQYRGVLQFNCATWTDFVDGDNVDGQNHLYHGETDWLVDGKWHHYTMTMTSENAKVYFDGKVVNEWKLSGNETGGSVNGLWTNGADLKYICLGGNQAWNWADPDPGFWFDSVSIYDKALTEEQIAEIISKSTGFISAIEAEETSKAVYYDLRGIKVSNPTAGQLYIRVNGSKATKVIF